MALRKAEKKLKELRDAQLKEAKKSGTVVRTGGKDAATEDAKKEAIKKNLKKQKDPSKDRDKI